MDDYEYTDSWLDVLVALACATWFFAALVGFDAILKFLGGFFS